MSDEPQTANKGAAQFHARLPDDLMTRLRLEAARQRSSVNATLVEVADEGLSARENKRKESDDGPTDD